MHACHYAEGTQRLQKRNEVVSDSYSYWAGARIESMTFLPIISLQAYQLSNIRD